MQIPQNSFMALMVFFSTDEKPLGRKEMDEFWNSCTPSEKHYYMCADIGVAPVANVDTASVVSSLKGLRPRFVIVDEWNPMGPQADGGAPLDKVFPEPGWLSGRTPDDCDEGYYRDIEID